MQHKIKYLPTLLDRLLDDEPKKIHEAHDTFHFDSRKMRAIVQRDLSVLLNSANIENKLIEHRHDAAMGSVVNYGVAPLTGGWANAHSWVRIEKAVRNAILRFEPRILPQTLIIRTLLDKTQPARYGVILFEIRALLHWEPNPIDLCIKGSWDTETESMALDKE